ncbi:hypothetical protein HMPREF9333_00898 [Johnsonella ignava ATCC 51276]|uniref:DUF1307 domain-containing protein n=1 Tax=Johnsonella ignava ATCC 51276 TaxID=679200 RepID=G5GH58_9FIRM|nr:DUF1307 domain-containing protein [Johnsonella ignava]EHI55855.1 hypothetical protein HMPREF9333_00898 [Johnsonella ignava ATCC 51276]
MKKIFSVLLIGAAVLSISACSGGAGKAENKEESKSAEDFKGQGTKTYVFSDGQNELEVKFDYNDDNVLAQTGNTKMMYSKLNVKTKEEAQKVLEPLEKTISALDGVDLKVEYGEDHYVEDISIDFSKVDLKKLGEAQGTLLYSQNDDLKMSKIDTQLTKMGYQEKN